VKRVRLAALRLIDCTRVFTLQRGSICLCRRGRTGQSCPAYTDRRLRCTVHRYRERTGRCCRVCTGLSHRARIGPLELCSNAATQVSEEGEKHYDVVMRRSQLSFAFVAQSVIHILSPSRCTICNIVSDEFSLPLRNRASLVSQSSVDI
jgi:hypothetical protein